MEQRQYLSPTLSVIIPAFNEELVIPETLERIARVLSDIDSEIILVDDGSTDGTLRVALSLKSQIPMLRIARLTQNQGHMTAISIGLEASLGQFIATIDADLQDPPEHLPEMLNILQKQDQSDGRFIDVVQTYRIDRATDSIFKRKSASFYYKIIGRITGIDLLPHAADYRMMTREVVNVLLSLPERQKVYRLIIPKLGFEVYPFPIVRSLRFAGKTKYSKKQMFGLAIDSVIGFTYQPLRLFAKFGFISSILLAIAALITLIVSISTTTVPGWPSVVLLMLSINAVLIAGIGLLGEYIGRIYEIAQARPYARWFEC